MSGSPVEAEIGSDDIYPVVQRTARKIVAFIRETVDAGDFCRRTAW